MSEPRPHGFALSRIARPDARLVAYDWAWARDNAGLIAENWRRRRAERPGLFDGPVLMACDCTVAEGACSVSLFETTYSRFIAYRDGGRPDGRVANAFAALVPWTADGAVLLGEMGAHTANAGQVYFPCGTPDLDDVRGEAVDLAGSAERECAEETGLVPPADAGTGWLLLRGEGQLAFLRPVLFPEDAATLRARAQRHWAGQAQPELAGLVAARTLDDLDPARAHGFARAYLAAAFAGEPGTHP